MDMITLAMAKKYTDQKAGYMEFEGGAIRFDGDISDKINIPASELGFEIPNSSYVRISEKSFPARNIKGVTTKFTESNGGSNFLSEFDIADMDGASFVFEKGADTPLLMIISAETELHGTYVRVVWKNEQMESVWNYVSYVEGKIEETIHTIDQKFIPGAVLPVVELSEETINTAAANVDILVDMTADEVAFFTRALADKTPCVARATMSGISVAAVANLGYDPALLQAPCYKFEFIVGSFFVAIRGENAQIMYHQN